MRKEYAGNFIKDKLKNTLAISQSGFFYLEKYLRVFEKTNDGSLSVDQVYNIKEFQEILRNRNYDGATYISDNFGNADLRPGKDDLDEMTGTIGIKFGVRLVYSPPAQFEYEQAMDAAKERTYSSPAAKVSVEFKGSFDKILNSYSEDVALAFMNYFSDVPEIELPGSVRSIPVVTYEKDILDRQMSEIDLEDDDFGEDLKCYIDNLAMEKDFDLLFDGLLPSKPYVSLMAVYSYYCFINSIGEDVGDPESHETDEDAGEASDNWKGYIFSKSKKSARKLFNATYRTDDDVKEEGRRERREVNVNFLKNLLPGAYLNLDTSVKWFQKLRMVDLNPFDDNGNDCKSEFQKVFDGA